MKLESIAVLLMVATSVSASLSSISLGSTGNFAKLSTKQGMLVSIVLLKFLLMGEFGVLPYKFIGRKRRSNVRPDGATSSEEKDDILKLIRVIDHRDCLLRYICELEAARISGLETDQPVPVEMEADMILLKIASRASHPAILMTRDPSSPILPFEVAVFTGSKGVDQCSSVFHSCPINPKNFVISPLDLISIE